VNLPSFPMRSQRPYQVTAIGEHGSISGTVAPAAGQPLAVRGSLPVAPEGCVAGGDTTIAGTPAEAGTIPAVVWLDDIRRGRALDETRRFDLVAGRCSFDPAVQVAIFGGTINVRNFDRIEQELSFHRTGFRSPLLRIPFTLNGQLVPSTTLLHQPGLIEARTSQDSTLRAFVFVVDHPYAVVAREGRFTIDSVPPGRYTLRAWSPAGLAEMPVEVRPGATVQAQLTTAGQ
jgi:hypothetical protein